MRIKFYIYVFITVCFNSHFTDVINIDIVNAFDMEHMAKKYLFVKRGGHSSPKDCKSYQKVAIIVPYRDRMHHLKILLNRLHPMLYKQQIEYRIFLVEQVCWWYSIIAIYHLLPIQCSPLRQQPFSYLRVGGWAGIFIVLINIFSEPSSVKIFFSHEKESKNCCSYHVEQKYIFP